MNARNFLAELKRRNVYKVAVAYAVVGWLVIQVSSTVLPTFHAPEWVVQTLVVLVAIGFPIALVIAWAFELTPEGLKRTEDVDLVATARQPRRHAWIFIVIVGAALSIGVFFLGRYTGRNVANAARIEAFQQGLRQHGYVEGQNVYVEYRYSRGKADEYPKLAAELVSLKVDLIVAGGGSSLARAVKQTTKMIPIVITGGSDPVGAGVALGARTA